VARTFDAITFLRILDDATKVGTRRQKGAKTAFWQANDEHGTVIQQHHSPRAHLKIVNFAG
jgi:hypothetical protein